MLSSKYIDILITTLEEKKVSRQKWWVIFLLFYLFFFLGTDLRVGWLDKILVTVVSVNLSFLVYDPRISVKKIL